MARSGRRGGGQPRFDSSKGWAGEDFTDDEDVVNTRIIYRDEQHITEDGEIVWILAECEKGIELYDLEVRVVEMGDGSFASDEKVVPVGKVPPKYRYVCPNCGETLVVEEAVPLQDINWAEMKTLWCRRCAVEATLLA